MDKGTETATIKQFSGEKVKDEPPVRQLQPGKVVNDTPCFTAKTANEWIAEAMTRPIPKKLFGELVIEEEITVLFASTNVGKSILAVQIGQAIASGQSIKEFPTDREGRKVLFFDFELSARQFSRRYTQDDGTHFNTPFQFSKNFIRLENGYAMPAPGEDLTDYYIRSIKKEIDRHAAQVVIVDNLTWLNSKLEKSRDAAPFMQQLAMMKRDLGLTLILISHTPKRDASRPLDITDLAGSSMVGNFLDAALAIGKSRKDPGLRYLKQVKVRDGEAILNEENVAVFHLEKQSNFLGFNFRSYDPEKDHLKEQSDEDRADIENRIIELRGEGKSFRAIGDELGVSHMKVKRIAEKNDAKNDFPF